MLKCSVLRRYRPVMVALALGLVLYLTGGAQAAVLIEAVETGDDVIITGSGSYDVSGITRSSSNDRVLAGILADSAILNFGTGIQAYDFYTGLTFGPSSLGDGGFRIPSSFTGNAFSLQNNFVGVAVGTTSGNVNFTATFLNQSFATLGLDVGTYEWAWNGDSATFIVGEVNVVPVPATLPLLATALIGLGLAARRRRFL